MITSSRKLFYAVEAVLFIAYNAASGPISSRDIAEKQGLPPRYLEQLMQRLVRAGILRGVRGPNGGYVLAKEKRRISVGDICEVLGDEKEPEQQAGTPLGQHVVEPVWNAAQKHLMQYLKSINLADLCEQALDKNIRKANEKRMDFAI